MILCDSGPLIAAAASNDADHHPGTEMFTGLRLAGRRLLVPQTVVAEVGYMLAAWVSTEVEANFLDAVAAEAFEVVNLTSADFARMAELVRGYDDLPLGTTDARSGDPRGPQTVRKKSDGDRFSPTTSNGPENAFPQFRRHFQCQSTMTNDHRNPA